ncbi:MAG: bifunctional UDP-N-acetylmuramoyl-tripeptide:D-alanyl-D-alanine ligase/alanine racemase [Sphingobacterium sp.]
MCTIQSISEVLQTKPLILADQTQLISELAYDSRKINHPDHSLFFALTATRDGHDFIPDAYQRGVRNFIVAHLTHFLSDCRDVNVIVVANPLEAMQTIATAHRQLFRHPIVGITGSNGKSIVKAWLFQLLVPEKSVYQSPKSYNSQLGVALSLWNLSSQYDLAIIEAGISEPGEMSKLVDMIRPDIGILTNIGMAHEQNFQSSKQKLQEKLLLFQNCEFIIAGSAYLSPLEVGDNTKLVTWGNKETDYMQLTDIETQGSHSNLHLRVGKDIFKVDVAFSDKASIENVLTCITFMSQLGYSTATIIERVRTLRPLEMRLQLKKGIGNCSIIDDSYSNDIASLGISLDFLAQQNQHKQRTLILSEMEGLNQSETLQEQLASLINNSDLSRLIWVGPAYSWFKELPIAEVLIFQSTEQLIERLSTLEFKDESILIKGARVFQFERIVKRLSIRSHGTVLEINLNAIANNLMIYRSLLAKDVKLMAMVKAFSYGSGSFEIANLLQFSKVDYLTVAFADEGVELRTAGIKLPIMVLSPDQETFQSLLQYQLEPEIYSLEILDSFVAFLREQQVEDFPVHIKLDTGMHRLGFLSAEIDTLIGRLTNQKELKIASVFTHLVASGNQTHDEFTKLQIKQYAVDADKLQAALRYPFIRHLANTSAISRWPEAQLDMVRLGIGLYGIDLNNTLPGLQLVSRLKTTVTQVKQLPAGSTVGYDRKGRILQDSQIATVKIGYADGYPRRFGNGVGKMCIQGQTVSTIGNICMDMCMLDVTGLNIRPGDEIEVFPNIIQAADAIQTIPYELLVNVSNRVKRVYYYE